jgi:phospholipid transport system substrate-binding protein
MNIAVSKLFQWVAAATLGFGLMVQPAMSQDMPANEFVEKFSNEVLAEIKARKQELVSDPKKLDALIDQKVHAQCELPPHDTVGGGSPMARSHA